ENAEQACKVLRAAWSKYWQRLRAWIARRYGKALAARVRVLRVIEATPGSDGTGHIHIHAWWVGPFVRVELLRAMWGRALLSAGFPPELTGTAMQDRDDLI